MDISQLQHFLAVADEGEWSRAANAAHVSRATVQASVAALEEAHGQSFVVEVPDPSDDSRPSVSLTEAGIAFRAVARTAVAKAPAPEGKAGGRAKASKGRGRAPVVKGEPKPFKKRQGR
ncbi:LysR family transcriptional regulator [Herbiconiux sp. P15]|uniref:LysR family transcriptional regulator n=1 Tax=Herbiconiux liukaitaii TaxID=3342799 RepID=UPI0035B82159